jgi:hypothetical protein
MLNKNTLIIANVMLQSLLTGNVLATGHSKQVASIAGKYVIRFTEPAQRIPAKVSVDVPPCRVIDITIELFDGETQIKSLMKHEYHEK